MSGDMYAEKLAWFKENEKPEAVLLVADDAQLTKVVVAWTNTAVRRKESPSRLRGDSEGEVWKWLWENTEYSRQELIAKSALSEYGFDSKLAPLIGNRVLYPDGTINSFVQRYLREKVLKLFDAKTKRTSKKSS